MAKVKKRTEKRFDLIERTQKRTGAVCDLQSAPKSAALAPKTPHYALRGCSGCVLN